MARKYITHEDELAAALLMYRDENGDRWIPHEHAKKMHARQVISLFARDHHPIRHADGGPDVHWNITWIPIMLHRLKTAKYDAKDMAKERKVRRAQAAHKERMNAAYRETDEAIRSYWPKKVRKIANRVDPWPKGRTVRRRCP